MKIFFVCLIALLFAAAVFGQELEDSDEGVALPMTPRPAIKKVRGTKRSGVKRQGQKGQGQKGKKGGKKTRATPSPVLDEEIEAVVQRHGGGGGHHGK